MQALAVFQGGFAAAAAQAVAGADLRLLTNLIGKFWLRHDGQGRYTLHPLLRQHVQKKAVEMGAAVEIGGRHAHYYAQMLAGYARWLQGDRQPEAVAALLVELGNMAAAWRWLAAQPDVATLSLILDPLYRFFQISGRLAQGVELLEAALADAPPALLARLHGCLAAFYLQQDECETAAACLQEARRYRAALTTAEQARLWQLGGDLARLQARYAEAETAYQEALALDPEPAVAAEAYLGLGTHAIHRLDHPAAQEHLAAALTVYRSLEDQRGIAAGLRSLGTVVEYLGHYEEAEQRLLESLALRRSPSVRRGMVSALIGLGNVNCVRDEYEQSWRERGERPFEQGRRYYEESLTIARELGARLAMAILLGDLGTIYVEWEEYDEALRLFQECKAISQAIGDQLGVIFAQRQIGTLAVRLGHWTQAKSELKWVLQQGLALQATREVLFTLLEWSKILALHQPEQGAALVEFVLAHPACSGEMLEEVLRIKQRINMAGPAPDLSDQTLAEVVAQLLAEEG